MTHTLAALALTLLLAAAGGCDLAASDASDDTPPIPEDHPCAEYALAPTTASLWAQDRSSGQPVPLALALPLPPNAPVLVSQGNDQDPTHHDDNRWAWDFVVPEGTPVRAAAPGTVAVVRDDSTRFGAGPEYRTDANFVLVDHGGGLFSAYVHLAAGSAAVSPGDAVAAGEVLGDTGLSGQLTGPHLHFHLENVWSDSLPARFADAPAARCDLQPDTGDRVTADPAIAPLLVARSAPSDMPADAFAEWGVARLDGLPARLFERHARYRVSGTAAAGSSDVYLLLIPPEGGTAVAFWQLPVRDGRFSGEVRLSAVPAGTYGVGAVAVGPLDDVLVERTVRASVLE